MENRVSAGSNVILILAEKDSWVTEYFLVIIYLPFFLVACVRASIISYIMRGFGLFWWRRLVRFILCTVTTHGLCIEAEFYVTLYKIFHNLLKYYIIAGVIAHFSQIFQHHIALACIARFFKYYFHRAVNSKLV